MPTATSIAQKSATIPCARLPPDGAITLVAASFTVRQISPEGIVSTPIGSTISPDFRDGTGVSARFSIVNGLAVDSLGNLFISDSGNALVRRATLVGRRTARLGNLSVGSVAGTDVDTDAHSGQHRSGRRPTLAAAFTQIGALLLAADSRDASLLLTLLPGACTAQITPAASAPGIALNDVP